MFSGLVSASYWYVDVAIAVFLALFLIGGIIKGFAKSTKGFFAFVVIVCASALLMGVTQESAMESSIGTGIEDKISSAAGSSAQPLQPLLLINAVCADGALSMPAAPVPARSKHLFLPSRAAKSLHLII